MKRYWHVKLSCGKGCTMIIEDACSQDDAIIHAKDRFGDRVLTVV